MSTRASVISSVVGGNDTFMRFVYGAMAVMSMFITAYDKHDRVRDKFLMDSREHINKFDFIIVGGGTAGSIVANRLAETYKVLLLEAGGEAYPLQSIPGMSKYLLNHKEIDWMFKSVPQKRACQALKKHKTIISQGKGLGGSSNLGFLNYLRGSPFDYENWANLTGNPIWKYSNLLPYFRRQENYEGFWKERLTHGFEGEMHMETPNYTGMADRFIRAGMEMKYKFTDLNGLFFEGFDFILSPMRRGYRQGAGTAFLNSKRPSTNLVISKFSAAHRILFKKDRDEVAAYGVVYERHGKVMMAIAEKEVIISTGAINTPKLLMLSGIGPRNQIDLLKIPLVRDLPVGKNLQDHLITYIGPFVVNASSSFLMDRDLTAESVAKFGMAGGQGPLTSTGIHANGIVSSDKQKATGNLNWSDLHFSLYGMSHHETTEKEFIHMYNLQSDIARNYFNRTKGQDSFSIIVSLGRPHSRGRVRLPGPDLDSTPLINPRYLSDRRDVQIMVDGIMKAVALVDNSNAFREIGANIFPEHFPGCESFEFKSRSYWECYIREFSMSGYDPVGTCSMGRPEHRDSVVDSELRVLGVANLRVIDSSVIPFITVGGTLAPTMVVAERGAELVRSFWSPQDADLEHGEVHLTGEF